MFKTGKFKRVLSVLILISLLCSNISSIIFGLTSYAIEQNEEEKVIKQEALEIEISEFNKNSMLDEETEYEEKLKLNLNYEEAFKEVVISDVNTSINKDIEQVEIPEDDSENDEMEEPDNTNIFYKTTKINKEELINVIGNDGYLEIDYKELILEDVSEAIENDEEELENEVNIEESEDEEITLETEEEKIEEEKEIKGVVIAEEGKVTISSETEADEAGYITIVYPEKTISIEIKICALTNEVENFNIINTRNIEKATNLDVISELETVKNISVKADVKIEKEIVEIELLNTEKNVIMPIAYSQTVAELGIDKNQLSTSIENEVSFTITMLTNSKKYDLFKNPHFLIELPSEVKTAKIKNAIIINNNVFEPETIEQGILENGNNAIAIKLNGEQEEYTHSVEENIQMVFEMLLTTEELIPTLDREVKLHYINENANTYNGIEQEEEGISIVPIQLVSNSEIMVETAATIGEKTTVSRKDDFKQVTVEPNTYNQATIIGTAINNTGSDLQDAKILISASNIGGPIVADEVYYTENENASNELDVSENLWTPEYTINAKKALIMMPEFEQGQTVNFKYLINLPEKNENDIEHVAQFEVYDSNNQVIKTSKLTINQEAEYVEEIEQEKVTINMMFDKEKIEVGEALRTNIEITNNTDETLKDISMDINIPEEIKDSHARAHINGEYISLFTTREENSIKATGLNIEPYTTVVVEMNSYLGEYKNTSEKIVANIKIDEEEMEISNKIKVIEPSIIETAITSDKIGKTLKAEELIEYKIRMQNVGNSHARINATIPELENISIIKIDVENFYTGKTSSFTGGNLSGKVEMISLDPGEVIEITVKAATKVLKKDALQSFCMNITGNNIYDTTTDILTNKINKQEEVETVIQENNTKSLSNKNNAVKGIAWIDKNENGRKDDNEIVLKDVQTKIINTENSEIVAIQRTNNKGEYEFTDLPSGRYIVEFNYNDNTFKITDYKNEEVEAELDSDIINTTQGNKTTTKTEVISLKNGKVEDVNAGFIVNKRFDISINETITKVTINNKNNTNTYEFNKENSANIKLKALKNSLLLVEYEIAITNTGEIAGYAKLISNSIPEGMVFNSELNTNWYEENDGKIYSVALENNLIQPGETAILKIILTREIDNNTSLEITSKATLERTFNEYLIEDKDEKNNSSNADLTVSTNGRRK